MHLHAMWPTVAQDAICYALQACRTLVFRAPRGVQQLLAHLHPITAAGPLCVMAVAARQRAGYSGLGHRLQQVS